MSAIVVANAESAVTVFNSVKRQYEDIPVEKLTKRVLEALGTEISGVQPIDGGVAFYTFTDSHTAHALRRFFSSYDCVVGSKDMHSHYFVIKNRK